MKFANTAGGPLKSPAGITTRVLRVLCCSLSVALAAATGAFAQEEREVKPPPPQNSTQQPPSSRRAQEQEAAPPVSEDESESVSDRTEEATFASRPRAIDPATIMRTARFVFVHSKTIYVKDSEVENALRKRPEFQAWGLIITRDEGQADLVVEVERKLFTKRFVFTVIQPRSLVLVTSGKARSIIFGDTIAHKVAEKFVHRMAELRPLAAQRPGP